MLMSLIIGSMSSQQYTCFTKTIKVALTSSEEERALLRARSAVQRFPAAEWRQRMEDFHRRSINTSRHLAGVNASRASDCDGALPRMVYGNDDEDWTPAAQTEPTQPNWDTQASRTNASLLVGPFSELGARGAYHLSGQPWIAPR